MEAKVKKFITENELIAYGDRIVVAVSGGPDSMCLLYLLYRLRLEWGIYLHVVHVNHHLRGSESDAEAEFVRYFAKGLDVEATIVDVDVKLAHSSIGGSKQEVARDLRYEALHRVIQDLQANKLAVAHNAEDQAETVLLHIIRGTGLEGLTGIPLTNGVLIRPLLSCSRTEILSYLKQWKLDYCIDSSNLHTDYSRNKLRLKILPLLEEINPGVVASVNRLGELARIDEDYMAQAAQTLWEQVVEKTPEGLLMKSAPIPRIHPAMFNRLCRMVWKDFWGHHKKLEHAHIEKITNLLIGRTGAIIDLPLGLQVEKTYEGLLWCIKPNSEDGSRTRDLSQANELDIGVEHYIDWAQIRVKVEEGLLETNFELAANQLLINPAEVKWPLCIRSRREGDRIRPLGGEGSKKLKDFFIDNKIPRADRDSVPLLADASGQIWWIIGVRKGMPKHKVKLGHPYLIVTILKSRN